MDKPEVKFLMWYAKIVISKYHDKYRCPTIDDWHSWQSKRIKKCPDEYFYKEVAKEIERCKSDRKYPGLRCFLSRTKGITKEDWKRY